MIRLRVVGWDAGRAWTDWSECVHKNLERPIARYTGQPRREVKRLVQLIRSRQPVELLLVNAPDRIAADSISQFLEAVGAIVQIEDVELAPDP